jgi:hypothetical protein
MPIPSDRAARWVLESIASDLPFKYWDDWMFLPWYREQRKLLIQAGTKPSHYKWVYLSLNRPISKLWATDLRDCLFVDNQTGSMSYVGSPNPLSPETLYRYELYPLLNARGASLFSLLEARDFPFSMARQNADGSASVAVASADPRTPGSWRVTFFDENVGPTGHFEVADAEEAIKEMINRKYLQVASPKLLDEIASTFPVQVQS